MRNIAGMFPGGFRECTPGVCDLVSSEHPSTVSLTYRTQDLRYRTLATSGAPDYPARQDSQPKIAMLPGKQALALS